MLLWLYLYFYTFKFNKKQDMSDTNKRIVLFFCNSVSKFKIVGKTFDFFFCEYSRCLQILKIFEFTV